MRSDAKEAHGLDEPLGGVVLVPANSVPVVHGELVVEVVVSFADGDQGSEEMVARGVLVVEGGLSEVVSKGVDAKRGLRIGNVRTRAKSNNRQLTHLVNEAQPSKTSINIAALPVAPEVAGNDGGENVCRSDEERHIVVVLPPHNRVLAQVADVSDTGCSAGSEEHPAKMSVEEALVGVVGVEVGVGVTVVGAVLGAPPFNRTLGGTGASESEDNLQGKGSVVGTVRPETMVTSSNTCIIVSSSSKRKSQNGTHRDR